MIGKTLTLTLAASLLALANPVSAGEFNPEEDDALACKVNIGTCTYGPCGVNVGYCGGSCDVNVGTCDGPDCGINVGTCGPGDVCRFDDASSLQLFCLSTTTSAADISCDVNIGQCQSGPCGVNVGYCGGSCGVNVGTCDGPDCGINVGTCGTGGGHDLCAIINDQYILALYVSCPGSSTD